jgi:hypothetical protein
MSIGSTIIEEIHWQAMRKSGLAFYCDFREGQKKNLRGLLSSVLVQLCRQSNSYAAILSEFYSEHENVPVLDCHLLSTVTEGPFFN